MDDSRRFKIRVRPHELAQLLGVGDKTQLVGWRIVEDPDALYLTFTDDRAPRQVPDSEIQIVGLNEFRNRDFSWMWDAEKGDRPATQKSDSDEPEDGDDVPVPTWAEIKAYVADRVRQSGDRLNLTPMGMGSVLKRYCGDDRIAQHDAHLYWPAGLTMRVCPGSASDADVPVYEQQAMLMWPCISTDKHERHEWQIGGGRDILTCPGRS